MPIYSYECECGHTFTDLQKMPGKPSMLCPKCHDGEAKRVFAPCAFKLVGQGWHDAEYDKYGPKKPEKKEGGTEDA